jgi:hypothetical protein
MRREEIDAIHDENARELNPAGWTRRHPPAEELTEPGT